ncbi:MAG: hypothetical protein HDT30_10585 [Clostridiales bacterium]|nr:hypothetical protein [Clostridiales bacterium]
MSKMRKIFIVLSACVMMIVCIFIGRKIFISFPTGKEEGGGGWIEFYRYIYVSPYMALIGLIIQCFGIAVFDIVFFHYYLMYTGNKFCKITINMFYAIVCIIRYLIILIFNFPIGLGDLYIVDIVDAGSGFFGILHGCISLSFPILFAMFVRGYKLREKER